MSDITFDSVPEELVEVTHERLAAEAESFRAAARRSDAAVALILGQLKHENVLTGIDSNHLERDNRQRNHERAADEHHLFLNFTGAITSATVASAISRLTYWLRTAEPDAPIEIQFNSPGGEIVAGFALWDFIKTLQAQGHPVTTSSIGMAASMAGVLLQAGDTRIMGREAWLMIHEASFGAQGKIGEVEDTLDWVKMVQKRIINIFAARSNLSARQLETRWKRKNWWIDSDEALKLGLVDELR